jgi:phosphoglycerate dehydrogenase-like enzyme
MAPRPKSLYVLREDALCAIYGPHERERVATLTDPIAPPLTALSLTASLDVLSDVEVLMSGWGGPRLDHALLERAPKLSAVFYAGGSLAPIMTPAAWERGLLVTSASAANAIPVAEYTVSMMLLALKGVWRLAATMHTTRAHPPVPQAIGAYQRCVGLVSLGAVGRAVVRRLKDVEVRILAYDPFVSRQEARRLGVTLISLPELFARADVVSLHAPCLEETVKLVRSEHLRAMKPGATFINTSRGALVDERALIDVASERSDLQFILDVTETMPLPHTSPLYSLPNVLLTPHIAGSCGTECQRLGRAMVDELQRYVTGEPLRWCVSRESARHTAHEALR